MPEQSLASITSSHNFPGTVVKCGTASRGAATAGTTAAAVVESGPLTLNATIACGAPGTVIIRRPLPRRSATFLHPAIAVGECRPPLIAAANSTDTTTPVVVGRPMSGAATTADPLACPIVIIHFPGSQACPRPPGERIRISGNCGRQHSPHYKQTKRCHDTFHRLIPFHLSNKSIAINSKSHAGSAIRKSLRQPIGDTLPLSKPSRHQIVAGCHPIDHSQVFWRRLRLNTANETARSQLGKCAGRHLTASRSVSC